MGGGFVKMGVRIILSNYALYDCSKNIHSCFKNKKKVRDNLCGFQLILTSDPLCESCVNDLNHSLNAVHECWSVATEHCSLEASD